jgi:tRNA (uracil-5-)-methyltransferase
VVAPDKESTNRSTQGISMTTSRREAKRQCFFCQNELTNGLRSIPRSEVLELSSQLVDESISLRAQNSLTEEIVVCWNNCPLTTTFLIQKTRSQLDNGGDTRTVIRDAPFQLGYMEYDPDRYDEFLATKREYVVTNLVSKGVVLPPTEEIETFPSPKKFFRSRCRLGTHVKFSEDDETNTADTTSRVEKLTYLQWDEQGVPCIEVEVFPIATVTINRLLVMMKGICEGEKGVGCAPMMCRHLSSIHLLSSLQGQAVITFVYDKEKELNTVEAAWRAAAAELLLLLCDCEVDGGKLGDMLGGHGGLGIIGQSKGAHFVEPAGKDHVMETLQCKAPDSIDEATSTTNTTFKLFYKQPVDGFSNPNGFVNQLCLGWLCSVAHTSSSSSSSNKDSLLELYCGAANHTVALSRYYHNVVCVELNKALCTAAEHNLALNDVHNVKVVHGPSEKFAKGLLRKGCYKDGETLTFGTVLVDPPRGGLDSDTRALLRDGGMDQIIYISCNPDSLVRDLSVICAGDRFRVRRFAVFDHFAYSSGHLESGVFLVKTTTDDK